jgi:inorganic phosphate transporter, PiT family
MTVTLTLVIVVIVLALIFDFLNGFHDAVNSIPTAVASGTLTPGQTVIIAGLANFAGYFAFGIAIAKTVGQGIVHINEVTLTMVLATLIGAIAYTIVTWIMGLPTSSSHALVGSLVGSAIASSGFNSVMWGGMGKIAMFVFLAPLIGLAAAIIFTILITWIFRKANYSKTRPVFKYLQIISSFGYGIGHGTNDAQKTMGIIALALYTGGLAASFELKGWVIFVCYAAMALGTIFGGWRTVKTMGTRITAIRTKEGFCAETASALVLIGMAHFGIPVSTTHVISGSIMGVGAVEKQAMVRWIMARNILWSWLLTIPLTALCAGVCYKIIALFL